MDELLELSKKVLAKKIVLVGNTFIAIACILWYGVSKYSNEYRHQAIRYATLSSDPSKGLLSFDSSTVSESDAKIVYMVLEQVEYFSPFQSNRKALFDVDSNKVYRIHFSVGKNAIDDSVLLDTLGKSLAQLRSYFPNRQYQFILSTVDSSTQYERQRVIRLN